VLNCLLRFLYTCRFEHKVEFNGKVASKKTLHMIEGTALPYTLDVGCGAFVFMVDKDLSVFLNGER
jgi:hypothetical protein